MVLARGAYDVAELGDFPLQCGGVLQQARISYRTHGRLTRARDNAVLFLGGFAGTHVDLEWLIGRGRALDPNRHFVICPDLFGCGVSTSPSTAPYSTNDARFPTVTVFDNVKAQNVVASEVFGIRKFALVLGGSMGALQAFQWAVAFPARVPRLLAFCGAASTSEHTRVFIDGVRTALKRDRAYRLGDSANPPDEGLKAFGRIYAGWGLSQQFYWQRAYQELGYVSLEDFLTGFWEQAFLSRHPADLLSQLDTWYRADIGLTPGYDGDRVRALQAVEGVALVLSAEKDLYFPPEDEAWEVRQMPRATHRLVRGIYGHYSCSGIFPEPGRVISSYVGDFLQTSGK